MLPTEGRAIIIGRVGAELDVETGRKAAYLAALNGLAVAREYLGSLDNVTRIIRLGVLVATSGGIQRPQVKLNFLAAIFFKFDSIRISRERRYACGRASIACPT